MTKEMKLDTLLVFVSRSHQNVASKVFSKLKLPRGQPPVLFKLEDHEGVVQADLAKKLEVTPATLTNLLHRMERSGLVRREKDEIDVRATRVYLTEKGKATLEKAKLLVEEMDQITFSGFSETEREQMWDYLERVHQNLKNKIS